MAKQTMRQLLRIVDTSSGVIKGDTSGFEKGKEAPWISGGSGGGATPTLKPTPTLKRLYKSDLLNQGFISQDALKRAEQDYYNKQITQAQQEAIKKVSIQNQINLRGITNLQQKQQFQTQLKDTINKIKTAGTALIDTGFVSIGGKTGTEVIKKGIEKIQNIEIKRLKTQQDLIKKYDTGVDLSFREGDKIKPYVTEQKTKEKKQEEYLQKRISVIDTNTGVYRPELKSEYLKRTSPTSLTEEYFELYGTKFYGKGEREAKFEETYTSLDTAKDYQSQQKILEDLKKAGIKIDLTNDTIKIDSKTIAPTNTFSNILIGLTDIGVKGQIFNPFMSSGVASKQQVKVVRKLSDREKLELYKRALLEAQLDSSKAREVLKKAILTGDKNKIKQAEEFIKNVYADTIEGRYMAQRVIRDIKEQEGLLVERFTDDIFIKKTPVLEKVDLPLRFTAKKREKLQPIKKTQIDVKSDVFVKQVQDVFFDTSIKPRDRQILSLKTKLKEKQKQISIFKQTQKQPQKQRFTQIELLKIKEKQKELQKQRYRYFQDYKTTTKQISKQRKIPKMFILLPKQQVRKKIIKSTSKKGLFIPEIRRRRVWLPLGDYQNLRTAYKTGKGAVLTSLGASFRIRKGKDILPLKSSQFFKPSKKEPGVLIQMKKGMGMYRGRLSTPQERREIILSKLKKMQFFKR